MKKRISKLAAILIAIASALLVALPSTALAEGETQNGQKYYLGEAVNAGKDTGYFEDNPIGKNDIHYSWELGRFFVSDYTRVTDDRGTPVFLKNVGDEVTLSFNLQQDIDQLNGNEDVTIDPDPNGYDQRFGVSQQDFGRGALFIRYTDYQNNKQKPTTYTNYLDGVSKGADTVVKTFEEGDYEVALDYSIKNVNHGRLPWANIEIFPGVTDYTMRFNFKVRNGNCMVYPFDVKTNEELTNTAFTENGFRLDLARSRYLDIDVKKETLSANDSELVADTRFNKPARDGEEFKDEGVYTFTVSNRYTGQNTTKMVYVGSDPVLKAHATTGKPVSEIKEMLAEGATVDDDGTIAVAGKTVVEALPTEEESETAASKQDEGLQFADQTAIDSFTKLNDPVLLRYVEDTVYNDLVGELDSDKYLVENVEAVFVSQEYIDEMAYNSRENIFFGYTLSELDQQFQGKRYIFTTDEGGKTTVKEFEAYDDTYDQVIRNVATGSGVILVCVTVSVVSGGTALPAVSMVFATAAKAGAIGALSGGLIGGVSAGAVTGMQSGDMDQALKSAVLGASEGYKWGAISGALTGGASEAIALKGATLNGLTMNEAAAIQKESKYPLDVIKQFHKTEEYKVFKDAGLKPTMVDGRSTLVRDIDLLLKDDKGRTNLERMKEGLSPLTKAGEKIELHHVGQKADGTLAMLTTSEHDNPVLHGYLAEGAEGVQAELGAAWDAQRKAIWKAFAAKIGG